MKLAVFSDVHGNLAALEAVKADIDAINDIDLIWCLGDLSAGGSHPSACLRLIAEWRETFGKKKFKIIGGNTDRYLVTGERFKVPPAKDEDTFSKLAEQWSVRDIVFNWNLAQLTWADYELLSKSLGREVSVHVKGFGWVIGYHAIPGNDEPLLRPDTPDEEVADFLLDREGNLAIGAHIHVQMDRQVEGWRVINVGSVGLSFDAVGKAQYGLFSFDDAGNLDVDLRAIDYDVDKAIDDLHTSGHPAPEWAAKHLKK